jgi:hypothetical protein
MDPNDVHGPPFKSAWNDSQKKNSEHARTHEPGVGCGNDGDAAGLWHELEGYRRVLQARGKDRWAPNSWRSEIANIQTAISRISELCNFGQTRFPRSDIVLQWSS